MDRVLVVLTTPASNGKMGEAGPLNSLGRLVQRILRWALVQALPLIVLALLGRVSTV